MEKVSVKGQTNGDNTKHHLEHLNSYKSRKLGRGFYKFHFFSKQFFKLAI